MQARLLYKVVRWQQVGLDRDQAVIRLSDALDMILRSHTPPEEKAILNLERDEDLH